MEINVKKKINEIITPDQQKFLLKGATYVGQYLGAWNVGKLMGRGLTRKRDWITVVVGSLAYGIGSETACSWIRERIDEAYDDKTKSYDDLDDLDFDDFDLHIKKD